MKYLAVMVPVLFLATPAFAAQTLVVNNSGLPIDELFVSAPGAKHWSSNLMEKIPEGALDSGKKVVIAGLENGTFDLRISAPDEGVLCYMENVTVAGGRVELTPKMGKACK